MNLSAPERRIKPSNRQMKTCYQCLKSKEDSEFYLDNRSEDLLTASCKECQKARAKDRYKSCPLTEEQKRKKYQNLVKWRKENPERYKELVDKNNKKRVKSPKE